MKKIFAFCIFLFFSLNLFCQEYEDEVLNLSSEEVSEIDWLNAEVFIPPKKRPKSADSKKIQSSQEKDIDNSEYEKNMKTIKYGTSSEIFSIVDKINENEDPRYNDALYDLFYQTASNDVRAKILDYFAKNNDDCLSSYAVEILDDPYDAPISLVEKCFNYVSEVSCKEAAPCLVKILEHGDEKYFNFALSALGKTGGVNEAKYLAQYLERDDLTVVQRQSLMRTLGKMCAVETFDEVCLIAENEDENNFVRMYACEAIGNMKKEDAIPILKEIYSKSDPNLREYCIKGLANFPENEEAKNVMLQGIRDDHYKVRLASIKALKDAKIPEAVEFIEYRALNDNENVVKNESFSALGEFNSKSANDFLIEQITDKKVSDNTKYLACEALLKNGLSGEKEIIELAKQTLKDDRRKSLRNKLGSLFVKYTRPAFAEICMLYLQSKDAQTQSLGLDLYKNARYEMARQEVLKIAEDKNAKNANKKRAKQLLNIDDDEEDVTVDAK